MEPKRLSRPAPSRPVRCAVAGLLALGLVACGGTLGPTVRGPMSAAEQAVFDGAVDYVVDPMALGGTFAARASDTMAALVASADFIAVSRVRAAHQARDLHEGTAVLALGGRVHHDPGSIAGEDPEVAPEARVRAGRLAGEGPPAERVAKPGVECLEAVHGE